MKSKQTTRERDAERKLKAQIAAQSFDSSVIDHDVFETDESVIF